MKILVTGGKGFIGSHLIKSIRQDTNYQTVSMIRGGEGTAGIPCGHSQSLFAYGDISMIEDVRRVMDEAQPDIVVHLATRYAVSHQSNDIADMVNTNIRGIYNILECLRDRPDATLINASTCYVYATSEREIDENQPLKPQNLYALTKVGAEDACRFYHDNYEINILNLRLFPPYGPGDSPKKLIQSTFRAIMDGVEPTLSHGTQKWDFVFVGDVVECLRRSLDKIANTEGIGFKTLNVGTGRVVEVREIVRRIYELTGKGGEPAWGSAPKRKNEIKYLCCDNRALKDWLGWVPTTPMMGGGLEATIKALREERGV